MRNYRARSTSQGRPVRRRTGGDPDARILRGNVFRTERSDRELALLRRLAAGPATLPELREHLGHAPASTAARMTVAGLVEEGLVAHTGWPRVHRLTDAGREVISS